MAKKQRTVDEDEAGQMLMEIINDIPMEDFAKILGIALKAKVTHKSTKQRGDRFLIEWNELPG
jgi:hypothetical protein